MNLQELKLYADENYEQSLQLVEQKEHKKVFIIARPILEFLAHFFLIPKNVRLILSHLIEVMDTLEPIN